MVADQPLADADIKRLNDLLNGVDPLPASIHAYLRERQLGLAADLATRTPIYLDTRFWVDLRKASDAGSGSRAYSLLGALRAAVHEGRAFCPISASTFCELLQHADLDVRVATARIVDELSLGVSLVSPDELLVSEATWLLERTIDRPFDPQHLPLWTRLSHSLGVIIPEISGLAADQLLALQVGSVDVLWSTKLEEIAEKLYRPPSADFVKSAAQITLDSRAHAHEVTDFAAAYEAEATGIAQFVAPICARILRAMYAGRAPDAEPIGTDELGSYVKLVALGLIQDKSRHALRSMHVRAGLHAIIRLNRGRAFKANDLPDIEHAAAGVSYCRAFFTEGSLRTALTQPPLKLDQFYQCAITNDIDEAVRFVSSLS
jgi:hypothetical protein